jgi:hypothetical protein
MDTAAGFIPGLRLGSMFFSEAARPIIESVIPADSYAAAFIGYGSDVLGFDSQRSVDHNWGPRFQLFLSEEAHSARNAALDAALRNRLPGVFHGYAVGFSDPDPLDGGTQVPLPSGAAPANHLVEITTIRDYFHRYLGMDVRDGIGLLDWLTFPEQRLLEVTSGEVFHDPHGELAGVRGILCRYPRDVWLYRMACQWQRLSQEEAFAGRCAEAGDLVGMKLVAARICRDVMKLAFLQEGVYAPYDKWLGTAFCRLGSAGSMGPLLSAALEAPGYAALEPCLVELYRLVAEKHNSLGVTGPMDITPRQYFSRPFVVMRADRFANALLGAVQGPELRRIPVRMGAIDQFIDSTDFIEHVETYRSVLGLYR